MESSQNEIYSAILILIETIDNSEMCFEWQFLPRKTAMILLLAVRFFLAKLFLIMYRLKYVDVRTTVASRPRAYRQVCEELYWSAGLCTLVYRA